MAFYQKGVDELGEKYDENKNNLTLVRVHVLNV